jgi:peptidyl-tRNA hydrolase, PTH1 family
VRSRCADGAGDRLPLMSALPLKLIVGLGNPGTEYARTRHNAGFQLVEELARRYGATFRSEPRHHAELARGRIGDHEVWLLKPMSYMNRSGGPVRSVAGFYKVPLGSILVAYDELDFPPGVVRLKEGGGAAGHNGMRDVIAQMGDTFWRLRIGIGHPGDKSAVLDYVLGRSPAEEARLIHEAMLAAVDVVPILLAEGPQKAMNRLHTRNTPPTPPVPPANP